MKTHKVITKKSVILILAFILICSFSVSAELVEEANSEKVIADYLAFEKAQQSAGAIRRRT